MVRAKKEAVGANDLQDAQASLAAPRRSMRKRKEVDYAAPAEKYSYDVTANKKKVTKSTKAKNVEEAKEDKETNEATANVKEGKKKATIPKKRTKVDLTNEANTPISASGPASQLEAPVEASPKPKPKPRRAKVADHVVEFDEDGEEIRKRAFQDVPHANFMVKRDRALSEHICFLEREPMSGEHGYPRERFTIMGTVGSTYTVTIKLVPQCTCRDFLFRRASCKHIIYTLHYVLKVPVDSELLYQHALTSSELYAMFAASSRSAPPSNVQEIPFDPNRKPVEGDCPVCYMDFEPEKDAIVYCRAKCGQNIHQQCMHAWLNAQRYTFGKTTCPYCREPWIH